MVMSHKPKSRLELYFCQVNNRVSGNPTRYKGAPVLE